MEKTLGQQRIGEFNPAGDEVVNGIKQRAADLIDYINDNVIVASSQAEMKTNIQSNGFIGSFDGSVIRLASIALTDIESAAMWAVKAHMHNK